MAHPERGSFRPERRRLPDIAVANRSFTSYVCYNDGKLWTARNRLLIEPPVRDLYEARQAALIPARSKPYTNYTE